MGGDKAAGEGEEETGQGVMKAGEVMYVVAMAVGCKIAVLEGQ
jgi:hypothetical protein